MFCLQELSDGSAARTGPQRRSRVGEHVRFSLPICLAVYLCVYPSIHVSLLIARSLLSMSVCLWLLSSSVKRLPDLLVGSRRG